jgi:hypothetical protein
MTVGAWIILRPEGHSKMPVTASAAISIIGTWRIHQAGESPFRRPLPILRQIEFLIFDTRVLFEWPLDGIQHPKKQEPATKPQHQIPATHQTAPSSRRITPVPPANSNC